MSIIDRIVDDIEKHVSCYDDWYVEISVSSGKSRAVKEVYSWNARSYTAAKAIKDYLVARGMADGALVEPRGSFIHIARQKESHEKSSGNR